MTEILICISAAVLGLAFYWFAQRHRQLNWERFSLLALSICLLLVLVLSWIGAYRECSTGWEWVFNGIEVVFQVFECDSDAFRAYASFVPVIPELLSCAVPVLTIFSALGLLWSYLPHHVPFGRKVWYIFSELDANSIRMANSLGKGDHLCVFLRSRPGKQDPELLKELQGIRYFLYPRDEARFLFWPWRRKHILRFFFLSENTDENFKRMQDFLTAVKERSLFKPKDTPMPDGQFQQELYLLSETESAPMLIDHLRAQLIIKEAEKNSSDDKTKAKPVYEYVFQNTELRLLDRFRATNYDLLRRKPLNEHIHNGQLNILVLGFGKIGREFFRAACSLGLLYNCKTKFTLCDQQIDEELAVFLAQCPELRRSVGIRSEALNVDTNALEKLITGTDYRYIVVALGDDERNIQVASRLKRFYRLRYWQMPNRSPDDKHPLICVNIEDSIKRDYTEGLSRGKNLGSEMYVFGGLDQVFTCEVLMPRNLWTAARYIHQTLSKKDTEPVQLSANNPRLENWGEYERRSSVACAVRAEYLYGYLCKSGLVNEDRTVKLKEEDHLLHELADTEHLRWKAYVRSEGMRKATLALVDAYYEEFNHHVDVQGKLSPCLVNRREDLTGIWDHLTGKPENSYEDKRPFRERNKHLVREAPTIAHIAKNGKLPDKH